MKERGGTNEERLFLRDASTETCVFKKTDMPDIENIIARHKARYYLVGAFCRPGMNVLDFPCGSGYAYDILYPLGINYSGCDVDKDTIEYADLNYNGYYFVNNLEMPNLVSDFYDVIACIEGIEHIEHKYQKIALLSFYNALKPGGTLVVSTPNEAETTNKYHVGNLDGYGLHNLLQTVFPSKYQIIYIHDKDHTGKETTFMYGICRKEGN